MKPHKHAELIKAWADGAEIEYYDECVKKWLHICSTPFWSDDLKYRVKPQQKLMPFTFDDARQILGKAVICKSEKRINVILGVDEDNVHLSTDFPSFKRLLDEYTFLDGTPCGKVQ